ncbi:MAG: 4-hydroxy-tetrahydrodipicolinate reductase [Bacteroidetes bacterium]|nr:MAG: 4-hydroxy-tetrahydrodipicolinate reductase [Bacteroidota bacterium]
MKIALLGYGKMGKEIEKICLQKGYRITARIDNNEDWQQFHKELSQADVAIDFSMPSVVLDNIQKCFDMQIPIVVGTTGWYDKKEALKAQCEQENQSMIFGSNFSIGVNLFFRINELTAQLMNQYPEYNVSMEEIHHTQKLDAPSGTAISLADIVINELDHIKKWQKGLSNDKHILGIESKRIDPTPGTHIITYQSDIDEIELKHTAKSRIGFAKGAVLAAEWIVNRKGWFEFKDILFNKD